MNIRQTSIDCYHQIESEGLLSKNRLQIYKALLNMGKPSTAREVLATINVDKQHARFTELREMGVIYERDNRECKITGKTAIEWDLTDNLPTKFIPYTAKQERINDALDALRELYKKQRVASVEDWKNVAEAIKSI